jgi:hypothetical protein
MSREYHKPSTPKKRITVSRAVKPAITFRLVGARLLPELRKLTQTVRHTAAVAVNAALATLYRQIGARIRREILREKRAAYGEEIVHALSAQLSEEFGRGFEEKNLRRMVQFAEVFPDEQIVAALRRQLGRTHFKHLIYRNDPLKRNFYAEMCRI